MLFSKKVSAETAFGPGPTAKEKAEKKANIAKQLNELKDKARKVAASEPFKDFKEGFLARRESLIESLELIDPNDVGAVARAQERLKLYREIFEIEKKAE